MGSLCTWCGAPMPRGGVEFRCEAEDFLVVCRSFYSVEQVGSSRGPGRGIGVFSTGAVPPGMAFFLFVFLREEIRLSDGGDRR